MAHNADFAECCKQVHYPEDELPEIALAGRAASWEQVLSTPCLNVVHPARTGNQETQISISTL